MLSDSPPRLLPSVRFSYSVPSHFHTLFRPICLLRFVHFPYPVLPDVPTRTPFRPISLFRSAPFPYSVLPDFPTPFRPLSLPRSFSVPFVFCPSTLLHVSSSTSRPFEDWIMEPRCRHRLTQLRDRVDSQDVPALTARLIFLLLLVVKVQTHCVACRGLRCICLLAWCWHSAVVFTFVDALSWAQRCGTCY